MKKILITALAVALTGCGGSSSETNSTQQQVTNNTPTLSGQLSLDTKAMSSASLILNMLDDDNDALTLTITEQPDWLTLAIDGKQATLNAKPDFFDIGEYTLQATVSDGKASKAYQLVITISDDPTKWQQVELSTSELAGIWTTNNEEAKFIFSPNNYGAHILNSELTSFAYQKSNEGDLQLQLHDNQGCYANCEITSTASFAIVASDNNNLRVRYQNDSAEQVFNLHKQVQEQVTTSYLIEKSNYPSNIISVIDNSSYLTSYFKIDTDSGYFSSSINIHGQLVNNQIVIDSNQKSLFYDFYNMKMGWYESLELAVNINTIDILYSDDHYFVAEQTHNAELLTDISGYNTDDYQGLNKALNNQVNLIVQEKITPISVPTLNDGNKYTGQLLSAELQLEEGTLNANRVFKIHSQTEFAITSYLPHKKGSIETILNVSNNGEELSYNLDDTNYTAKFFQKANGDIFLAQEKQGFYQGSLFSEVTTSKNITDEDIIGLYVDSGLSTSKETVYFAFTEDERAIAANSTSDALPELNSELQTNYFWTIENNRALMIHNSSCPFAYSYASCLSESQAGTTDILFRSLEYLGEYKDSSLYNYSYFYQAAEQTEGTGFHTLRLLQKQ